MAKTKKPIKLQPDTDATVEDFIEYMKAELDEFAADWKKNQKKDPDNWPIYMPRAEREEHFPMYLDNKADAE